MKVGGIYMKRKNYSVYVIVISVSLILLSTLLLDSSFGGRVTNIVTIVTAIIGAGALFIQFQRDKKINEISFILSLSHHFYLINGPQEILIKLDEYDKGNKDVFTAEDYPAIVAYLEWLEELAAIVNQNLIDFEFIDDFLSYRFFTITNNKYVQDIELISEYENYRGIYKLHKNWSNYKKRVNLPILNEETSLSKTENYKKIY